MMSKPTTEDDRRKERVRRTHAAAEHLARSLPDHIRTPFEAWMAADLGIEGMSERNRETVRTAILLAEQCGRVGANMDDVLKELEHRTEMLGDVQRAADSIRDDMASYPSRWPGTVG